MDLFEISLKYVTKGNKFYVKNFTTTWFSVLPSMEPDLYSPNIIQKNIALILHNFCIQVKFINSKIKNEEMRIEKLVFCRDCAGCCCRRHRDLRHFNA